MSEASPTSIEIEIEIESVFTFVSNVENLVHYWPKVKEVEKVTGEGKIGSVYKVYFPTLLNKRSIEVEVSTVSEPTEFAFINNSTSSKTITAFKFDLLEDKKTKVIISRASSDVNVNKAVNNSLIAKFFEGKISTSEFEKILSNLKKYLEDNKPQETSEEN